MDAPTFRFIDIDGIRPNPANPRKVFSGPKFDELVESVKHKGVLEPILIRPVGFKILNQDGTTSTYEIIAGERRYKASIKAGHTKIPALVREMTDEEAFDVMTIENLHREDLNEVEEAECFKSYLDAKGPEAAKDLSQRTGIGEQYIRRRVRLLTLPKQVIDSWREGKILYGHCEQLMRLSRKEQILQCLKEVIQENYAGPLTVNELRHEIDSLSPKMVAAKFDTKQCAQCSMNSSIQAGLFGDDFAMEKKKDCCLNPVCFKKKQAEWLTENWPKTALHKKYKTNRFIFVEDFEKDYGDNDKSAESWSIRIQDYEIKRLKDPPCFKCKDFISVMNVDLSEAYTYQGGPLVCIGDEKCFKKTFRTVQVSAASKGSKGTPKDYGPEYQDRFYREEIRNACNLLFGNLQLDNDQILRIIAFTLLNSGIIKDEFLKTNKINDTWGPLPVWKTLEKQDTSMLRTWIYKAALFWTLDHDQIAQYSENDNLKVKHLIAKHIGIDLARDWKITKEYLQCKTISEIVKIGKDLKIFDDPKVKEFAASTLKMKKENWDGMKKKDLIRLFLDSGVDLAGKVPKEILKVK